MTIAAVKQIMNRSLMCTIGMFLIWLLMNKVLNGGFWAGMEPCHSPIDEYCEANLTSNLFHQTMNTFSNLAYFFFGVMLLQIANHDRLRSENGNKLSGFWQLSALMGTCFVYLSFGSAFFHASQTWVGQRVDMNGTYGLTLSQISIGLFVVSRGYQPSKATKQWLTTAFLLLLIAFFEIHLRISSSVLLPAMILLLMLLMGLCFFQFRQERYLSFALLSVLCLVIAVVLRTNDVKKIGCDAHSFFQGHAAWHLLTGLSSFFGYAFYRFKKI